jgi:TonB family protein
MASFRAPGYRALGNRRALVLACALLCCRAPTLAVAQIAPAETPAAAVAADEESPAGTILAETAVSRVEAGIEFGRLVREEQYKAALPIGQSLLTLTEKEFGKNSVETASAYTGLADAQRRAGDREDAEKSYLAAIEIYRAVDGAFSPLAITPLTGLGDTYQDSGDYLKALSSFGEARTVSRRAYGLLNEGQVELLDRMTTTYVTMNQPLEADQQQVEALRLVERNNEPQSEAALAAGYKYAAWLGQNGRYQEERDQYARALRTIRELHGKDDVRQVRALMGIGNSFRVQRIPEGAGAGALRDALALLLAQPDRDEIAIAEALRDIGDWEIAFSKVAYDGTEYRRAWQLLGNVENGEQLRTAWFKGPTYVLREPISQRGLSQDPDALNGHVLVRFDLEPTGQSANAMVVESDPAGLKDEAVLRHIRRSRFRPQIVNGQLVRGEGLALQFNYRYTPDALLEQQEGRAD